MSEKKYALLPADDAVQNWFEENIDKECSASSAVYKFRLWLEELQGAPKPGAVWVKASTRLPPLHREVFAKDAKGKKWTVFYTEDGKYDIEIEESEIGELPQDDIAIVTDNGCFLKTGFYEICEQSGGYFDECVYKRDIVEWLDESGTPYESPAEQPVAHELEQLRQWKKEALLIINPIMEYAQGHKDAKLGSSITEFVIDRCKELDRIKAEQPVREVEFVLAYTPCMDDDPDYCGDYTSNDGQELCRVKEIQVPVYAIKPPAEWAGEKEEKP